MEYHEVSVGGNRTDKPSAAAKIASKQTGEITVDPTLLQGPFPGDFGAELEALESEISSFQDEASVNNTTPENANSCSTFGDNGSSNIAARLSSSSQSSENDIFLRVSSASSDNSHETSRKFLALDSELASDLSDESTDDDVSISSRDVPYSTSDEDDDEVADIAPENMPLDSNHETATDPRGKRTSSERDALARKRLRPPENWAKNLRRAATNQGKQYIPSTCHKTVPARKMGDSCNCSHKCWQKISDEQRKKVHSEFWTIPFQSRKYDFIQRYVVETNKKSKQDKLTRRFLSRCYYLPDENNEKIQVCQEMFLNTLDVSVSIVRTTLGKMRERSAVLEDERGKAPKISMRSNPEKLSSARDHINSFPRVESHYTRKDSSKEYLEEGLSIKAMYGLCKEWAEDNQRPIASEHQYTKIFSEEFNIGFFVPKKDQCDICVGYKQATPEVKSALDRDYQAHLKNKTVARLMKDADAIRAKENTENFCMACYDFQKILSTPKSESSSLYYKRKLNVYHFTIYSVGEHQGYCFVWSEYDAKKGSTEVATCVLHFIELEALAGVTDFYCDNCAGQNKNKYVISMYQYAAAKFKINITHIFLEPGHTQNEGDSVHATIEKYAWRKMIFTQGGWCDIIRCAKVNDPKYQVIEMTYDSFISFKDLADKQYWKRTVMGDKGRKKTVAVGISNFKKIFIFKDEVNQILFKTSLDDEYETPVTRKQKNHADVKKF
ncbi:hypothetical protein QAD02_021030 [Eretmocerus hayati]|uniref:Uncharacterized protein n=1 Tax=Eretmocerus hayati TaxID=131215 RepID=A0ACC2PPB1_9HYME|nr:hypothetical protein QAD02_021030 [Eretmocerus hayati]